MSEHTWQLSGLDGYRHAFVCDRGYLAREIHTAYLAVSTTLIGEDIHTAMEIEVSVAECHHAVPLAFLLPRSDDLESLPRCVECAKHAGVSALPAGTCGAMP